MKRALIISVLAAVGTFAMACTSAPDALTNKPTEGSNDNNKEDNDDSESEPKAEVPAVPIADLPDSGAMGDKKFCAEATNQIECYACCAVKHNPIAECICGEGAECATACGDNLCGNGGGLPLPSLTCLQCVLGTQCDIGLPSGGADLSAQLTSAGGSAMSQCMKGCSAKK